MKTSKIIFCFILIIMLSACAEYQNDQKQTIGTILGAGIGALAGSQMGKGKGKLVTVALGALGGAFAGAKFGKLLDDVDRLKANQAQQNALEKNADGISSTWQNPNTGHNGEITPKTTQKVASGEYCREYEHKIIVDGEQEVVKGTACRKSDGSWRVIN
jgi:surface antigen